MTHEDQDQNQPKMGEGNQDAEGEDLELRVESLRASTPSVSHITLFSRRRSRSRVARLALGATALVALVAVVAGAFALTRGGSGGVLGGSNPLSGALRNVLHVTPNPTPLPAWVTYPTPTLGLGAPPALGPLPLSCSPPAPAPRTLPATLAGAIGGSPLWVAQFDGPHATKYINSWGTPPTRYGWMVFVTFAVEPGVTDPVTVRGVRLDDGTPLWMVALEPGQTYTEATPSVAITLNPRQPGLASFQNTSMGLSDTWAAWAAGLYIPAPGCYALEARWSGGLWSGGSWSRTFIVS